MTDLPSQTPIDPRVVRRTLTIMGLLFGTGLLLSGLWVYQEVRRLGRVERLEQPARVSSPAVEPSFGRGLNTNRGSTASPVIPP